MDCDTFDISSTVVPPPPGGAHASTNQNGHGLPPLHRASTPPVHPQAQWSGLTHQYPPSPYGGTYHHAQFPPSDPSRAPNVWNGVQSPAHGFPAHGPPAHGFPAHGFPTQGFPTQGSSDDELMQFMQQVDKNPAKFALNTISNHQGCGDAGICKLDNCDGAMERKYMSLKGDLDELEIQYRYHKNQALHIQGQVNSKHISHRKLEKVYNYCIKDLKPAINNLCKNFGDFPTFFIDDINVLGAWLDKRLNDFIKFPVATPANLQQALRLTSYEHLNEISQDFFIVLLKKLNQKGYHESSGFKEYLPTMKEQGEQLNSNFHLIVFYSTTHECFL